MMDARQLRQFITSVAGALRPGRFTGNQDPSNARLKDLALDGGQDNMRHSSPFGFISGVPVNVAGFYFGLFGSRFEKVILGMLHYNRPVPKGPGETILYSTSPDGTKIAVMLTLGSDGSLTISGTAALKIQASQVDVTGSGPVTVSGSGVVQLKGTTVQLGNGGEKILNGETFLTDILTHTHTSTSPGSPTSAPVGLKGPADYLSQTVKAQK